jgi:hypothetical protein
MKHARITLASPDLVRPVPAWARVKTLPSNHAEAAFGAGASLSALDNLVRQEPAYAGVWRQRLALSAATSTLRLIGRREDEAALRDGWCFRTTDVAPGPGGAVLALWHRLAQHPTGLSEANLQSAATALGLVLGGREGALLAALQAAMAGDTSPLRAATAFTEAALQLVPEGEALALMLADLVLAARLRWPVPVPLAMTHILNPMLRQGEPRRRPRAGEGGWPLTIATAYILAATAALDLAADLSWRAQRLQTVSPKLRAKGADVIVEALLREDAFTPASAPGTLSDRALRRLFDRLVSLGAVRELSGRPSFRLYGL